MFLLLSLWTWRLTATHKGFPCPFPYPFSLCLFSSVFSDSQRIYHGFCMGISSAPCALGSKKCGCLPLKGLPVLWLFPGKYIFEIKKRALLFHLHQNPPYLIILLCIVAARTAWCNSYPLPAVILSAFVVTSNTDLKAQTSMESQSMPQVLLRHRQRGHFVKMKKKQESNSNFCQWTWALCDFQLTPLSLKTLKQGRTRAGEVPFSLLCPSLSSLSRKSMA